MDKKD